MLKVGAQLHKEARPPKSTGFGCGHLRTTNMTRVESSAGRPDVTPHCRAACAQKAQVRQGDNMQLRRQNRVAGRAWDRKDVCLGLTAYFAPDGPCHEPTTLAISASGLGGSLLSWVVLWGLCGSAYRREAQLQ